MPDTKKLRSRIRSVNSTLHLTHAMELVASSKIRRATLRMEGSGDYAASAQRAMDVLAACRSCQDNAYFARRERGRTKLVVIAGDRGLAGGYNANIFRLMREYPDAETIPIGKRACDRYGGRFYSAEAFTSGDAAAMAQWLCEEFRRGEYDRLGIVYTQYRSMMEQTAGVRWVLPLTVPENAKPAEIIFEPGENAILNAAVPEYVAGMLVASVRESFASEVAARRAAMDAAGKNAREMIDDLMLQYNRARQGAITQEITEIVAGSGQ